MKQKLQICTFFPQSSGQFLTVNIFLPKPKYFLQTPPSSAAAFHSLAPLFQIRLNVARLGARQLQRQQRNNAAWLFFKPEFLFTSPRQLEVIAGVWGQWEGSQGRVTVPEGS